jgi:hypothetical protein
VRAAQSRELGSLYGVATAVTVTGATFTLSNPPKDFHAPCGTLAGG